MPNKKKAPQKTSKPLVHIFINEDGEVVFSDLPEEVMEIVRELNPDTSQLATYCPVDADPASISGEQGERPVEAEEIID